MLPVVAAGLGGTLCGIGQAICAAWLLHAALAGTALPIAALAGFAVLALLRAACLMAGEHLGFAAGAAARRRLRTEALTRMFAAGPALLRRSHSGELAATVVDRVEALDGMFAHWLPASVLAMAAPALVLLALLPFDPPAAAILLGAGMLVPVGMAFAGIGAARASRRQFAALARLQARFLDRVRGLSTIVLAGRAEDEAQALGRSANDLRVRTMKVLRVAFLSSTVLDAAFAVTIIGFAVRYGALLAAGGLARPWVALYALLLIPEFFAPLRGFAAAYADRMHAQGAAGALAELPEVPPAPAERPVRTVEARGVAVAFEDVRLTWDEARGPALDGLSFRVPAGEILVLAGPSGAGKSTVLEILLGFATPESGRVTLNGADIATLVPAALSRLIAWIGQRPVLFAGTVAENIRFARPEASDDELREAAGFARLDGIGLDTVLGEGGFGLSGGQAQRVAIARAFLKNAPLLLLDEPTAHLDPATEAEVLDSLRRLTVGRTVILASHSSAAHGFGGRRLDLRAGRAAVAA
jgi:ATP-binding cassette subfamily C protein CydD